tara:strand:- start:286 stop:909 length:624 start_codon:yes stop_codon:yes gene_type:complete
MDFQKLIVYGIILIVGIYVLKDVCGVKLPFIEGFDSSEPEEIINNQPVPENDQAVEPFDGASLPAPNVEGLTAEVKDGEWGASEPGNNEFHLPVQGVQTDPASCFPQNTLGPSDLLPQGEGDKIQEFKKGSSEGEGILKGVNFLDAGFHVGVNTVGQSLRNANLNLRAEPPNPRTQVSPWMNSTIDVDLDRRPLSDGSCGPDGGVTA